MFCKIGKGVVNIIQKLINENFDFDALKNEESNKTDLNVVQNDHKKENFINTRLSNNANFSIPKQSEILKKDDANNVQLESNHFSSKNVLLTISIVLILLTICKYKYPKSIPCLIDHFSV